MTMTQKLRHRYHIESLVSPVKALFYCCATVYCSYLCFDPGRPWCPARLIRATDPLPTRAAGGLPLAHLRVHVGRPRSPILIALAGVACFPTAAAVRLPLPRLLPPSGDPSCSPCSHGVLFLRRFGASVAPAIAAAAGVELWMRGVLGGGAAAAPLLCISAPSRCPSSALSCSCPGTAAVAVVKGADRGSIHELRIHRSCRHLLALASYSNYKNMSVRPEASPPNRCRKRRHPMPICSEAHSANDGVSRADHSNYLEDFPTDFNFKANRPVRRRLCADLPQLHGADNTHQPRTKRKAQTSSCRLDILSSQTGDRDPPTSDAMLNGAPGSSSDFPTDFNFESTRRIRRRLHTHTSDLGQPDRASSPRLHVKRKSSASCRLSEPSCSRINEVDEDEQQPSNMQVSSSGHRQRLYLMNTLGYVMPR
ncbi:hypothetical protein EJB05_07326, partial [Eragrostis curvula]